MSFCAQAAPQIQGWRRSIGAAFRLLLASWVGCSRIGYQPLSWTQQSWWSLKVWRHLFQAELKPSWGNSGRLYRWHRTTCRLSELDEGYTKDWSFRGCNADLTIYALGKYSTSVTGIKTQSQMIHDWNITLINQPTEEIGHPIPQASLSNRL